MVARVTVPPLPICGGCQCGQVRFAIRSRPVTFYHCHCTECQRQSASAHGESLWVRWVDFDVAGETGCFTRGVPGGDPMQCWFCPVCGVRLWHRIAGDDIASVKAGTLDNTTWLAPAGHIWARSRQAGTTFSHGDLVYEAQPDDWRALIDRWSGMTAGA